MKPIEPMTVVLTTFNRTADERKVFSVNWWDKRVMNFIATTLHLAGYYQCKKTEQQMLMNHQLFAGEVVVLDYTYKGDIITLSIEPEGA